MIYLSAEYILSAIKQLASTHAFIGITFEIEADDEDDPGIVRILSGFPRGVC